MDIAALSTSMAMSQTSDAVGMALLSKGKEMMEQNGAQLVEMMKEMELSVNPNVGSQIDIKL